MHFIGVSRKVVIDTCVVGCQEVEAAKAAVSASSSDPAAFASKYAELKASGYAYCLVITDVIKVSPTFILQGLGTPKARHYTMYPRFLRITREVQRGHSRRDPSIFFGSERGRGGMAQRTGDLITPSRNYPECN